MNAFTYITGNLKKATLVLAVAVALCLASGTAQAQSGQPAKLNLVSVGISKYKQAPLGSPHKDALDVASTFQGQQGKLFGQVNARTMIDEQATSANILQGLRWAAARASGDSYTVLFLAGHGSNRNATGEFEFMTYDGKLTWKEIQTNLQNLPGKVMVIIDSCHSGALTSGSNLIVFSSSLSFQVSGETPMNGFFTQALLEGLSGKADMDKNGTITLAEVDGYVAGRLEQISFGKQSSTLLRPVNTPSNLPLTKVNTFFAGNPAPSAVVPATFTPGVKVSK